MDISIPYLDLTALQRRFAQRDSEALQEVQDSGQFIGGGPVERFENDFAYYCDSQYCISTGNGLDALTIILRSYHELGLLPTKARVLLPAHTYIATYLSIVNAGMVPVPVDVSNVTLTVNDIKNCQEPFDAIIAVDIYGKLVDNEVYQYAIHKELPIFTDAAQSHGAMTNAGSKSGSRGTASAFSFYPTKNLGAMGDGGAIICNDPSLAQMARKISNYGRNSRFKFEVKGVNSRLDTLQAAFLSNRLLFLDNDNKKRYKIAQMYLKNISNANVDLPRADFFEENAIHVFPVYVDNRDKFVKYLKSKGIGTNCHYPIPPHLQEAFPEFNLCNFPQTERLHKTQVSLPCHPLLEDHDIQEIIIAINGYT